MLTITTRDGTDIFYKGWGMGRPVVFSHDWPLNADGWDQQLFSIASIHGDDDRLVPIDDAGRITVQIVRDAELMDPRASPPVCHPH